MPTYSINIDDFSNDDYTLIGVHTSLEDYQFAFLLNRQLRVMFRRANYDLDFKNTNNTSYSVYEYTDKKFDIDWFLIANVYKTKSEFSGLFHESDIITYLIPEHKKVDFFLKIEGDFDEDYIIAFIEKINQISQVITSYKIEPNKLKSKDFLIF